MTRRSRPGCSWTQPVSGTAVSLGAVKGCDVDDAVGRPESSGTAEETNSPSVAAMSRQLVVANISRRLKGAVERFTLLAGRLIFSQNNFAPVISCVKRIEAQALYHLVRPTRLARKEAKSHL